MQLEFEIEQQHIKRTDSQKVVAGSNNYLTAHFSFSDEWIGSKVAIFKSRGKAYMVLLEDDNTCKVPWEAIASGVMLISVFCGDLLTTDQAEVSVGKTGYSEGIVTKDITQPLIIQILKKFDSIGRVEVSTEEIERQVQEYLITHPIEGVDEEQVQEYVSAFFY